jgi:hypothetical protein
MGEDQNASGGLVYAHPAFALSPTPNFHRPLLDFYFGLAIWLARS